MEQLARKSDNQELVTIPALPITSTALLMLSLQESHNKENTELAKHRMQLMQFQSSLNFNVAVRGERLSELKIVDKGNVMKTLNCLLRYTSNKFNVGRNLNDAQLLDLSFHIGQNYSFLTFSEMLYIFKMGEAGRWGEGILYNKFDKETVLTWINCYLTSEQYIGHIENENFKYKKQETAFVVMDESGKEKLKKIYASMPKPFPKEEKIPLPVVNILAKEGAYIDNLKTVLPKATKEELKLLLSEYSKKGWKMGVGLVTKETYSRMPIEEIMEEAYSWMAVEKRKIKSIMEANTHAKINKTQQV